MEYTRFPWAANEPPRADALRGLIEAFAPTGVSHIPFASIGFRLPFTSVCFIILIHPGQFHKCFSLFIIRTIRYIIFRCSKHYTVDWNGRRRLLGLRLLDPPKTFAGIA